uniref:Armadillo repeat-containing domain-containing protein n=1 Tax=Sphenodon punctatus TaxID=8508 RepID=A0A8D0L6U8_SPHPU
MVLDADAGYGGQDGPGWLAKMKGYLWLISPKNMLAAATGAGATYLLYKTLLAAINSPRYSKEPVSLAREWRDGGADSGELRRHLSFLDPNLDDYTKNMVLHNITRSVYLLESEASACTYENLKMVASFLDDKENAIKVQALNALKAFSGIRKFKIKIQEWVPKILELVTSIWDPELHIAGLRLLNGLPLPDHTLSLLRKHIPSLIKIAQSGNTLAQVQALKFLSTLAQKEYLLYDILNCQVRDVLKLFDTSQPGNLLYESLSFVEQLSEGRLTRQYHSMSWEFNELSLHEALFGKESHLADCLLSLLMHREEEVQMQACKVILSLQLYKEEMEEATISTHPMESSAFSDDGIQYNM